MKMRTTVKKTISILFGIQILIFITFFYSQKIFLNIEIAFLSAFLIILGSSYAYRRLVQNKLDSNQYEDERDLLDKIDDPHELYDDKEPNDAPAEELDLKQIVKEEKAKIKTLSPNTAKHGIKGSLSILRIVPYVMLALGFIALQNNGLLDLKYYLPSLLVGIVTGAIVSKEFMS